MTTHIRRAVVGFCVVNLAAGCGGESTVTPTMVPSEPASAVASSERTLGVELTTTATGDAGMVFSIEGPNIVSIAPAPGYDLVERRAGSRGQTRIDIVLVGSLQSGVIAWLTTKGVNSGNPYTAKVSQVAAGAAAGFAQRDELSAYRLTIRRMQ